MMMMTTTTTTTMIGDDGVDDDDDAATITFTDGSRPRLLVGNTPITIWQPFDGLPELMLSFALTSSSVRC